MKRVLFRPRAARDLERLPNRDRNQVEAAIERFAQTGSGGVKMLAGEGRQLRLRVADAARLTAGAPLAACECRETSSGDRFPTRPRWARTHIAHTNRRGPDTRR